MDFHKMQYQFDHQSNTNDVATISCSMFLSHSSMYQSQLAPQISRHVLHQNSENNIFSNIIKDLALN